MTAVAGALFVTLVAIAALVPDPPGGLIAVMSMAVLGWIFISVYAIVLVIRWRRMRSALRRSGWVECETLWLARVQGNFSAVLVRDPATGAEAALHVDVGGRDTQVPGGTHMSMWFAGDLRQRGVLTPIGGGHLYGARQFHRRATRRMHLPEAIRRTAPTGPIKAPAWMPKPLKEGFVESANYDRAHWQQLHPQQPWDAFDLAALRRDGYKPPTAR
jgi:hypothetical protein